MGKEKEERTMNIKYEVDGKTVYEVTTYTDGTVQHIKVRECNNEAEAAAVANYYRIRKA